MLARVFSTEMLQRQLIACCCGVHPQVTADLAIDNALSLDRGIAICALNVTNKGPTKARDVVVTVKLGGAPVGRVVRVEPDQSWTQRDPDRTLVAELGSMDQGQTAQLRFLMAPRGSGLLTAKAGVKSNTVDLDPSNNELARSIEISEQMLQSDLSVSLQTPYSLGGGFNIKVHNGGPATVFGAGVTLGVNGISETVRFRMTALSPGWGGVPGELVSSAHISARWLGC